VELLVKVWEGKRKFLDVPKESTGSFFRHMRVQKSAYEGELTFKTQPPRSWYKQSKVCHANQYLI